MSTVQREGTDLTGRDFFDRYGVTLVVVGLFALFVAILPGNTPATTLESVGPAGQTATGGQVANAIAGDQSASSGGSFGGTNGGGTGALPGSVAGSSGTVTGPLGQVFVGQGQCRPDGRQSGVSTYMPVCIRFEGGNGGATSRGVTADSIKVVRYRGQVDPATQAILEGAKLADPEPVRARSFEAFRRYYNQHFQTYGREVKLIDYQASGPGDNDQTSRADAIKIANDIGAFAVIIGTPDAGVPKVMAQELAQRGVICLCTTSLSSTFYLENPPYIFGSLPTSTEYAINIAEFIGKRMKNKKAEWAGDEFNAAQNYQLQDRKFGLIYINGASGRVDPEGKRARDALVGELNKYGVKISEEYDYNYQPGRNQQDITTNIARMWQANITTVITLVDPLYPILLTQEATKQGWFPEWFITGTGLSDTTAAGRLYDQQQWQHAFGISPLWVTWETVPKGPSYREVYHGDPSIPAGQQGVLIEIYGPSLRGVFYGIHMAGPVLTADTFAQGMFNFPPTGGRPAAPLVYFTREYPTAIKDFIEVWYDHERPGPDERGEQGTGMMIKVDVGKRYRPGEWPNSNPKAFVKNGKDVSVTDNPPGGGDPPHEQDGHRHEGACLSCPGYKIVR